MDEGLKDETGEEAMRVLSEALAIEPSAGFEARVRRAIAERRAAPRPSRAPWIAAAAALLAAGIGLVVAPALREDPPPPSVAMGTTPATPPARTTSPPPIAPSVPAAPIPPARITVAASRIAPVRRPARPAAPSAEAERIVRYALLTRAHPLAEDPFARSAPAAPLAPPAAIAIAPVVIEPIDKEEGSSR